MRSTSNLLLLLAAAIWGLAFVAQRVGMDHVGPFTFNGVRFALGSLSLVPLMIYFTRQDTATSGAKDGPRAAKASYAGLLVGAILFIAASLQQIGLVYTTAGKAAFITCLYIVLVPITGIFLRHRITLPTWLGSILAVVGLYFLCVKESLTISYGDLLELIGAFFWTAHILVIDHYSRKVDTLKLACFQFLTCSVLSLLTAVAIETITTDGIVQAAVPLLYGGVCSVGIAYTLQIVGQKHAAPAHAAIILSMETVFAALGGYLLLDERLGPLELLGCALMLAGMLLSQLQVMKPEKPAPADQSAA
ncbi:MAG TPA: DMT family transporter [Selenomonadales bacterium]|nr:DMT family transporter [Selenomonadales bacterium]